MRTRFAQLMDEAWDYHQNSKDACAFEKLYSAVLELSEQVEKSNQIRESVLKAFNDDNRSQKP